MSPRTFVIVNPKSARGSTGKRWRKLEPRVRDALGTFEIEYTRAPRDAERLAREAVRAGVERLVVAGGDGTWAEVVTGLLRAELGRYARLGLLPMGTGSDFARSLGVSGGLGGALALLRDDRSRRIDAGRVRYTSPSGAAYTGYFTNVASLGISTRVIKLARRTPRWLPGRAAFALSAVRALPGSGADRLSLCVDGETVFDGAAVLVAVANGCFFGGGIPIAPAACIEDGLLDVVCIRALSASRRFRLLPKLYRGAHGTDPSVRSWRGACIEAIPTGPPAPLERDGDVLGALPVRIDVLPGALDVIGPAA